ncbi:protein DMP2-like [Diospyros lotus]|uniref:protein DMP2-like n=1 Tax=Diospyros lotus TaxID=55363 RepID=UPI00225611E1|nr:protein DMP2-like [Diospyros lotus]
MHVSSFVFQQIKHNHQQGTRRNSIRRETKGNQTSPMAKTRTSSNSSMKDKTFSSLGSLIRLLPTGTVFLYQFLNPLLTNNGHCSPANKYLSTALIATCGLSCFLSTFTDSYADSAGAIHYAIATFTGLWPASPPPANVSSYKLRPGDFVHAFFSLIVFAVVSLLDSNTVRCFYPSFESTGKVLLMVLPPAIGAVSASVFMLFPNKRHGIGYPSSPADDDS